MTSIVVIGIELSARTQVGLLAAEIVTLALFAVVALVKVYAGDAPDASIHPSLSWFNPFSLSPSEISAGMLLAVFIYWGWDTTATVNEETEDPSEAPGKATVISTLILLGIYLDRRLRGAGLRRRRRPDREPGRRAQLTRHRSLRLAPGQDPDHRRAHLGRGLDPDDDPADRADHALDGPRQRDAEEPRQGPPPLPHPARLDDPDGGALDPLVRRPDPGQRRHPLRLAGGAGPDDLLLHRPHRLRLHDLLPARAAAQRQELLLRRRRPDRSAARSSSTC